MNDNMVVFEKIEPNENIRSRDKLIGFYSKSTEAFRSLDIACDNFFEILDDAKESLTCEEFALFLDMNEIRDVAKFRLRIWKFKTLMNI